jgi:hypothetical protein
MGRIWVTIVQECGGDGADGGESVGLARKLLPVT